MSIEAVRPAAAHEHGVDRVARRSGDVGDDRPLLADELVEERRLADVRPAEDRDANLVVRDRPLRLGGEPLEDLVEQVARVGAVQAGQRERVAEAERVELDGQVVARRVVDLVRQHQDRLLGAPQDVGELLVAGRDAGLGVDDEQHEVGLADRGARLDGDLLRHRARVGDVDAARVDQQEALAVPLADERLAIARRALLGVDDRGARGGEPVDQRRLPDVREAHDRDRASQRRLQQPGLRLLAPLPRRLFPGRLVRLVGHSGGVSPFGRPRRWTSASQSKSVRMRRSMSAVASLYPRPPFGRSS